MKKVFLFALATAVMSFAGCQEKEQEAPVNPNDDGSTFEFVADIAKTKTTLDVENGYKVDWEEGDLIYMVTSDGAWGAPYENKENTNVETIAEFIYAEGKFTSEATIADGEYIFKGMYAAPSQKTYHRGASSTHKLEAVQTQNCANPTAHIKANDALVGTFTATVPMAEMAKMNMSHLYTLMQVNVKNATGDAVDVAKFEMTAEGADLAGIFNVTAFDTPALTTKQDATSTITVNVTGGSVEDKASLPVYFVMAPLSNYAGDVTFKVTDSEGKTYTKTVTMNGISFEAGKYNTTPYTIKEADKVQTNVTWDLSQDQTSEATTDMIAWESDYVSMNSTRASSQTTAANNYYPGANSRTSTRFYKGNGFNLIPKDGYAITSAIFEATSTSYASAFVNSVWTNAILSADDTTVTLIPSDGTLAIAAILGGTAGFTSVVVNIVPVSEYEKPEAPMLTSITLSGQKTDYYVGDNFEFDGTVTANYSYGSPKVVTEYTVSDPDMSSEGTETVTVTYTEGEVTVSESYDINLTVKPTDDDKPTDGPLVWTLVTNVSDLAVGDEIIIAAKDYDYALSTTQNSNNRGQASVSKSDNTLDAPGADVQILTLMQGSTSGTFAFYTGSNYLYAASSSNNYLKQQSTLNANASWKITIADGIATIVAQGSNTRNTMQYNQSSGLFACYGSASQKALAIYKQMPSSGDVGGTTPDPEEPDTPDTPETGEPTTVTMTSFSATSASMDENVSYTTAKGGGTSAPAVNSNQIRLYQNSAGTGGGTITITAKDGYKLSSVTIGSSMATNVAYTIGASTTMSSSASVSANGKYTVDDINATSITFYCMGTTSSSRLYVNYLSATYEAN